MDEAMEVDDGPAHRAESSVAPGNQTTHDPSVFGQSGEEVQEGYGGDAAPSALPPRALRNKARKMKSAKKRAEKRHKKSIKTCVRSIDASPARRMTTRSSSRSKKTFGVRQGDKYLLELDTSDTEAPSSSSHLPKLPAGFKEPKPPKFHGNVGLDEVRWVFFGGVTGFVFFLPSRGQDYQMTYIPHPGVTFMKQEQLDGLTYLLNTEQLAKNGRAYSRILQLLPAVFQLAEAEMQQAAAGAKGTAYALGDEMKTDFWSRMLWKYLENMSENQSEETPGKETSPRTNMDLILNYQGEALMALITCLTTARLAYLKMANGTSSAAASLPAPRTAGHQSSAADEDSETEGNPEEDVMNDEVQDISNRRANKGLVGLVDKWMALVERRSGQSLDFSGFSALSL